MKALINFEYDPALPLQTKRGAQQALRVGHNKIDELIKAGVLGVVYTGRLPKITTTSILQYATTGDGRPQSKARKPKRTNVEASGG